MRWWQLAVAALVGIALGVAAGRLIPGGGRTAIVDLSRVLDESNLGKSYTDKLNKEAAERRDELAKITDAQERAAKASQYSQELEKLKTDYQNEVLKKLDKTLGSLAKSRGASAVYVRGGAVRYAELDLTTDAIKAMNK